FLRRVVGWTWWLGPLLGGFVLYRLGGWRECLWGVVAGSVVGVVAAATIASLFLVVEIVPHALWGTLLGSHWGPVWWLFWVVVALASWAALGAGLGLFLHVIPPLRRVLLRPIQQALGSLCRMCGLRRMATYCSAM